MRRKLLTAWLFPGALLLASGGCGTIFSPPSQTVNIQSEPEGVDLFLDGQRVGATPVNVVVDRDTFGSKMVMLRKEGYETKQFHLKKTINSVAIFNFTLMTPWTTDAATGNMIEYSPNNYYIELKPKRPLAGPEVRAVRLKRFVLMNYDHVVAEILNGGGEYVASIMAILEVPQAEREHFVQTLRGDLPGLLQDGTSFDVIRSIQHHAERG